MQNILTQKQQEIVSRLVETYQIDGSRILFLNPKDKNDPWLPASQLEKIARQIEGYRNSSVNYDQFINATNQHIYVATVVDSEGRVFTRSGVATVGESPIEGEEFDAHSLAAGRALSAALKAAGFHPCEVMFQRESSPIKLTPSEVKERQNQLGIIHKKAKDKGFIKELEGGVTDLTEYREMLKEKFGTATAATLDEAGRKAVLNYLDNYDPDLESVPEELREEALYV